MAKVFYLIGASGSGKDSLLNAVVQRPETAGRFMVAQRHITRSVLPDGEQHLARSILEFEQLSKAGKFLFEWQAHGFHYGIDHKILSAIGDGQHVLINGSRGYLTQARQIMPALHVILVRADPEVLELRLISRGRETKTDIKQRLLRAKQYEQYLPNDAHVIDNTGVLNIGVMQLLALLTQ